MNILVTGGAGFIGSHIAERFIQDGHRVVVFDNFLTGKKENIHPDAIFYEIDIRDEKIKDIIRNEKIEVIYHQAAQIDLRKSVASPIFDAEVNILGSINICEAAKDAEVKKIIFSSTGGAIYGEQTVFPAPETHQLNPLSPYGIAKLSFEKYLFYYKHVYGLDYVILRYANIYGPRQESHGEAGVVAIFIDKILSDIVPVINGDGTQTRDFTFVGDVVNANSAALSFEGSDIFNVGTGKETDINALWNMLKEETEFKGVITHGPAKDGEQKRSVIDSAKITKTLGWKQKYDIETGLKETVQWFKNRAK